MNNKENSTQSGKNAILQNWLLGLQEDKIYYKNSICVHSLVATYEGSLVCRFIGVFRCVGV